MASVIQEKSQRATFIAKRCAVYLYLVSIVPQARNEKIRLWGPQWKFDHFVAHVLWHTSSSLFVLEKDVSQKFVHDFSIKILFSISTNITVLVPQPKRVSTCQGKIVALPPIVCYLCADIGNIMTITCSLDDSVATLTCAKHTTKAANVHPNCNQTR